MGRLAWGGESGAAVRPHPTPHPRMRSPYSGCVAFSVLHPQFRGHRSEEHLWEVGTWYKGMNVLLHRGASSRLGSGAGYNTVPPACLLQHSVGLGHECGE